MKTFLIKHQKSLFQTLLFLSLFSFSYSQSSIQLFKVISLPRSAGYSLQTLNNEISSATTKKQVITVVKSHKQLLNVPIVIRIKKSSNEITWWQLNPNQPEKVGDFTVFQSKATEAGRFYKRREVQQYFKDTIVVFDTLKLSMYLQDEDFRIENYFLKLKDSAYHISIPYDKNNSLLLTDSLFHNQLSIKATLYNSEDTSKTVADMNLYFLNQETKASLRDIAENIKADIPEADSKEIADYMSGYIRSNYGFVSYKELVNFLLVKPE